MLTVASIVGTGPKGRIIKYVRSYVTAKPCVTTIHVHTYSSSQGGCARLCREPSSRTRSRSSRTPSAPSSCPHRELHGLASQSDAQGVTRCVAARAPRRQCVLCLVVGGSQQADSLQDHGPALLRHCGCQHGEVDRCTSRWLGARSCFSRDRCSVNAVAQAVERNDGDQGDTNTSFGAVSGWFLCQPCCLGTDLCQRLCHEGLRPRHGQGDCPHLPIRMRSS